MPGRAHCWRCILPMNTEPPFPIRTECPPGTCVCERDALLAAPGGDVRILRLYEGTTQIQQMVIGRELQRMAKAGEI